jgi:hypothetical protein
MENPYMVQKNGGIQVATAGEALIDRVCVQRRGCVPPNRSEVLAHLAGGRITSGEGAGL